MTDKKLTDSKIVKALEEQINDKMCEYQRYEATCGVWCSLKGIPCCDMSGKRRIDNCKEYLPVPYIVIAKATLDLVNRLEAENEILQAKIDGVQEANAILRNNNEIAINNAIKEFAERLCEDRVSNDPVVIAVKVELKELVGEDNASKN